MLTRLAAGAVCVACILMGLGSENWTDNPLGYQISIPTTNPPTAPSSQEDPTRNIRGNPIGENRWGILVQTGDQATASTQAAAGEGSDAGAIAPTPPAASDESVTQEADPLNANQIQCLSRVLAPAPPASDPRWQGNDPSSGSIIFNDCSGQTVYEFMPGPNPVAVQLAPPTAEELAEQAYRELYIAPPVLNFGPDRTKLAVNLWTWLWTDDPEPQTITVAAGGISVTATATLGSVTWSLGEPPPTGGAYTAGPPVTVTCQGTGSAPPANYDWKAEPPCGHKYTWMSTSDRTGGTGKWPITATTTWNVTWQSNTGVTGATTLSATGTDALEIGEYRTVLVQGAGG